MDTDRLMNLIYSLLVIAAGVALRLMGGVDVREIAMLLVGGGLGFAQPGARTTAAAAKAKVAPIAIVLAVMLLVSGCSAAQSAGAKVVKAVTTYGWCSIDRVFKQCGPVAKSCFFAQLAQCAGFAKKAPWVQPRPGVRGEEQGQGRAAGEALTDDVRRRPTAEAPALEYGSAIELAEPSPVTRRLMRQIRRARGRTLRALASGLSAGAALLRRLAGREEH